MVKKTEESKKAELRKPAKHDADPRKESIEKGEVTTDSGAKVEPVSPAIPHGAEYHQDEDENMGFTDREARDLVGELEPGEDGWLPLDEEGNVTGPAKKGIPPEDQQACKVFHSAEKGILLTPAGAPIAKRMNADPPLMAEHELADEEVTKGKKAQDD